MLLLLIVDVCLCPARCTWSHTFRTVIFIPLIHALDKSLMASSIIEYIYR